MPKIHVHTAFNLLLRPTSSRLRFEPGVHDVDEDVASHWYTAEHATVIEAPAEIAPEPEPEAEEPATDAEEKPEADAEGAEEGGAANVNFDRYDIMSDDELRAHLKASTGRSPHPATGREKLLAAARGSSKDDEEQGSPPGEPG